MNEARPKTESEELPQLPQPRTFYNPFAPPSPVSESHQVDKNEPLWNQCDSRPRAQQVTINEAAVKASLRFFEQVDKAFIQHGDNVASSLTLRKEIATIKKGMRECEVLIGLLGETGTGKTTCISSLIQSGVLPRNEEAASTAVVVEIRYNHDEDPSRPFRAEIEGVKKAEFVREVEALFEDKQQWDMGADDEDVEYHTEAWNRMTEIIAKIKALYPSLETPHDLSKTSAKELLSKQHVVDMLDSNETLWGKEETAFARDVRKYIEANAAKEGSEKSVSLWPLVKVVRIYLKSEFLKYGIVLVDLPGLGDTSAARVAVAENYRKNLKGTLVCAAAPRAGEDHDANELLMTVEQSRKLKYDGIYTIESLFFVITQIDRLFNYRQYIEDHKEKLEDASAADLKIVDSNKREIAERKKALRKREATKSKMEENLQNMQNSYDSLAAKKAGAKKRKRESSEEDKERDKKQRDLKKKLSRQTDLICKAGNELYEINTEMQRLEKELFLSEGRLRRLCIQNRAQVHDSKISAEFEKGRRMMTGNDEEGFEKPLKVFSISAESYTLIVNGEREEALKKGFSTTADTGIPQLKDAILSMTWPVRQQNAHLFNMEVNRFLTRMRMWSMDSSSEYKMSDEERSGLETRLNAQIHILEQKVSQLHIDTKCKMLQSVQEGIYEHLPTIAMEASKIAMKDLVRGAWTGLHFSTHRAINKRHGVWTTADKQNKNSKKGSWTTVRKATKKISYDWNEELAGVYLDLLIKHWNNTFHTHYLELLECYDKQVDGLIPEFVDALLVSADGMPQNIQQALESLRETLLGVRCILKSAAADIFHGINNAAKNAHRMIKPEAKSSWESAYETCGATRGKDMWASNKETHRNHAQGEGGAKMYHRAGKSLRETLQKELDSLEEKFKASCDNAVARIRQDLTIMLDGHSLSSAKVNSAEALALAKEKLKKILEPHVEELEKAWGIEPEAEKDESEEVESEIAFEDDPDIEMFDPAEYDVD
ncbi:hypothetical protein V8E51_005141 [Hyaloscypha variabilis]